jgi:putative membrane protein
MLTLPVTEWRRLSPRMLIIHPVVELIKAIPALAGVLLAGTSSGAGPLWGLVAVAVVVALALTRWFTTRYRITPEQIQMKHGLLRRRTIAAPIERVRTVDVTAHLLHRMLGLARVSIGTGTSDRRGRGGLVLDGLDADDAAFLRTELLHHDTAQRDTEPRDAEPRDTAQRDTEPRDNGVGYPTPQPDARTGIAAPQRPVEEELARLDPSWIRFAPFTLSGAVTALALAGFTWRVVNETGLGIDRLGPLHDVAEQLRRIPIWLDVVGILIGVLAFIAVASTVGYVLAFWGFRLSRHSGGSLHVSRGLLTSRNTSIERRRLRGAEISEPLLLRAVGGARCLAIATGLRVGRGAERGGSMLLPPAPRAETVRVAGAVLETREPFAVALQQHGPAARRRRHFRALGGVATLVVAAALLSWASGASFPIWLPTLPLLPIALLVAADRYRNLGHGLAAGYLVTRSGSLLRRHCAIEEDGIVGWKIRRTYFQRRVGLATLTAATAAGRQGYRLVDVTVGEAARVIRVASPGLLEEFGC